MYGRYPWIGCLLVAALLFASCLSADPDVSGWRCQRDEDCGDALAYRCIPDQVCITLCQSRANCDPATACPVGFCRANCADQTCGVRESSEDPSEGQETSQEASDASDQQDEPVVLEGSSETPSDQCASRLEVCNGKDDDCDGIVDNDVVELGKVCTVSGQQGSCQKGVVSACSAGKLECKGNQPIAEICDGEDNDCNGMVDDTFPEKGMACQLPDKEGACRQGTYTQCLQGRLICEGPSSAQEICDGVDNDCDGSVDEEFPALGTTCKISSQQGPCAQGTAICASGEIACQQINQPTTERCGDGIDDDCDGTPDNGCTCTPGATQPCFSGQANQRGVGTCQAGIQSCANGRWGACVGEILPAAEVCNNKDDDCNGKVDDVAPSSACSVPPSALKAYQRCLRGVRQCSAGQESCTLPQPKSQTLLRNNGFSEGKMGACSQAHVGRPYGLALAPNGVLYISDANRHQIYKIDAAGKVTLLAGGGTYGHKDDLDGTKARFNSPRGVALDDQGNLYVADSNNHAIRKITPMGAVTTLAGGSRSRNDGKGSAAGFSQPHDLAWNAKHKLLYVADTNNHRIRAVTLTGVVTTIAGAGSGFADGPSSTARFRGPRGLLYDAQSDALLVADTDNHCIRRVALRLPNRPTSTYLGSCTSSGSEDSSLALAKFDHPMGLAFDVNGDLFVADQGNQTIRRAELSKGAFGKVLHLIGVVGKKGFANASLADSVLGDVAHIVTDAKGQLYIADRGNALVRWPQGDVLRTYAGERGKSDFQQGDRLCAAVKEPMMFALHPTTKTIFLSDPDNHAIYQFDPKSDRLSIYTGGDRYGYQDGPRGSALWNQPHGLAFDRSGVLYVADTKNGCIRAIDGQGQVSTYAGKCGQSSIKNALQASGARFAAPLGLAFDAQDNLYVTDDDKCVRKILQGGGRVTTLAGDCSLSGSSVGPSRTQSGSLRPAFQKLAGIVVDRAGVLGKSGDIYLADQSLHVIRKVTQVSGSVCGSSTGYRGLCIRRVAGQEKNSGKADGASSQATFNSPFGLLISAPLRSLLVTEEGNHLLRRIDGQGVTQTLAGSGYGFQDGVDSQSQFKRPAGLIHDAQGNLYIADSDNSAIRRLPACP